MSQSIEEILTTSRTGYLDVKPPEYVESLLTKDRRGADTVREALSRLADQVLTEANYTTA